MIEVGNRVRYRSDLTEDILELLPELNNPATVIDLRPRECQIRCNYDIGTMGPHGDPITVMENIWIKEEWIIRVGKQELWDIECQSCGYVGRDQPMRSAHCVQCGSWNIKDAKVQESIYG